MSATLRARPAGTPSMTAVSASPWDSPAVRKRKVSGMGFRVSRASQRRGPRPWRPGPRSAPLLGDGGGRRGVRALGVPEESRGQEHDQLPARLGTLALLEEPPHQRNVAEDRDLADFLDVDGRGDG